MTSTQKNPAPGRRRSRYLTEYGARNPAKPRKASRQQFCWPEGFKDLGATPRPALIIKLQERDIKREKLEILVNNFRFANEQLVHRITAAPAPAGVNRQFKIVPL